MSVYDFTCAVLRAIHHEIFTNLTVESFLYSFGQFTGRQSVPRLSQWFYIFGYLRGIEDPVSISGTVRSLKEDLGKDICYTREPTNHVG